MTSAFLRPAHSFALLLALALCSSVACKQKEAPESSRSAKNETAAEKTSEPAPPAAEPAPQAAPEPPRPVDTDTPAPEWKGPLLAIATTPHATSPGGQVELSASLRPSESGAPLPKGQLKYEWQPPQGWTVEGQGAAVKLQAPKDAAPGMHDVRLVITTDEGQRISGGLAVTVER